MTKEVESIKIDTIVFKEECYPRREGFNNEVVDGYRAVLKELPPIVVTKKSKILVDGKHRLEAFQREGRKTIPVEYIDIPEDVNSLLEEATRRNRRHGLRLTNADKRELLLKFMNLKRTQKEIADIIGVNQSQISRWRKEVLADVVEEEEAEKVKRNQEIMVASMNGMSQTKIAKDFGISQQAVSKIITDTMKPKVEDTTDMQPHKGGEEAAATPKAKSKSEPAGETIRMHVESIIFFEEDEDKGIPAYYDVEGWDESGMEMELSWEKQRKKIPVEEGLEYKLVYEELSGEVLSAKKIKNWELTLACGDCGSDRFLRAGSVWVIVNKGGQDMEIPRVVIEPARWVCTNKHPADDTQSKLLDNAYGGVRKDPKMFQAFLSERSIASTILEEPEKEETEETEDVQVSDEE